MDGYFLWARNQNNSCSINNYIRSYPAMYPIVDVTSMKPLGTLPLYPKCKTEGYYANPGCKTYYLCERNSYNDEINSSKFLYAPTGYLFDQTTRTFKSASKFKCQI